MANKDRILQDYGVQPFSKDKDETFVEFSQRSTWFTAMTKALQKHSEFMRPWEDDYPQMEYGYPPYQGVVPDGPMEGQSPTVLGPGYCSMTCFDPFYCDEGLGTFSEAHCFLSTKQCPPPLFTREQNPMWDPILECNSKTKWLSARIIDPPSRRQGLEIRYEMSLLSGGPLADFPVRILPPTGGWAVPPDNPPDTVQVWAQDASGNLCENTFDAFCFERDCCTGSGYVVMTFDDGSTPDTIAPGGSVSLSVQNGCSPYNWSVSGTGYTLDAAQTSGVSNTLNCASGVCGIGYSAVASVTVTDKCGTSVTFYLRNTGGQWTQSYSYSDGACTGGYCGPGVTCDEAVDTVYHENRKKWTSTGAVETFAQSDCYGRGGSSQTAPTFLTCPGDTLARSETSCGGSCCWCSASYFYWTCSGGC